MPAGGVIGVAPPSVFSVGWLRSPPSAVGGVCLPWGTAPTLGNGRLAPTPPWCPGPCGLGFLIVVKYTKWKVHREGHVPHSLRHASPPPSTSRVSHRPSRPHSHWCSRPTPAQPRRVCGAWRGSLLRSLHRDPHRKCLFFQTFSAQWWPLRYLRRAGQSGLEPLRNPCSKAVLRVSWGRQGRKPGRGPRPRTHSRSSRWALS